MDPDANLKEQRSLREKIMREGGTLDDAIRLAELSETLDEWMSKGGFLPEDWRKAYGAQ